MSVLQGVHCPACGDAIELDSRLPSVQTLAVYVCAGCVYAWVWDGRAMGVITPPQYFRLTPTERCVVDLAIGQAAVRRSHRQWGRR